MNDGMTTFAVRQRDQKRPRIKAVYYVYQLGKLIYENTDPKLCNSYVSRNALKNCTITSKKR